MNSGTNSRLIWFCLRRNGASKKSGWTRETSLAELRSRLKAGTGEVVEACVNNNVRPIAHRKFSKVFFNRVRGIRGIELELGGKVSRYAPTRMIASNLSFERVLQKFPDPNEVSRRAFAKGGQLRAFSAERDGQNWNFYSGEALLFWAEALRRGESFAPSLQQYMAAFRHSRSRHRRSRNPAFVPWHTQACAAMYAVTRNRVFVEFSCEMNDWLLPMQQNEMAELDLQGPFYNPKRPDFGPPHAASTGVYLEGLADALALARSTGDTTRAEAYRSAIDCGMRNLRQLQFRDHRDAFYISRKSA